MRLRVLQESTYMRNKGRVTVNLRHCRRPILPDPTVLFDRVLCPLLVVRVSQPDALDEVFEPELLLVSNAEV